MGWGWEWKSKVLVYGYQALSHLCQCRVYMYIYWANNVLKPDGKEKKVQNKPGSLGWVQIPRDPMASPVCFYFTLMARAWSGLGFEPR